MFQRLNVGGWPQPPTRTEFMWFLGTITIYFCCLLRNRASYFRETKNRVGKSVCVLRVLEYPFTFKTMPTSHCISMRAMSICQHRRNSTYSLAAKIVWFSDWLIYFVKFVRNPMLNWPAASETRRNSLTCWRTVTVMAASRRQMKWWSEIWTRASNRNRVFMDESIEETYSIRSHSHLKSRSKNLFWQLGIACVSNVHTPDPYRLNDVCGLHRVVQRTPIALHV